jgi:hypothetical protein
MHAGVEGSKRLSIDAVPRRGSRPDQQTDQDPADQGKEHSEYEYSIHPDTVEMPCDI